MPRSVSIPDYALTEPVTYYVDGSSGDDTNDGLTPETAFETIGKPLSVLPRLIEDTVVINVAAGDYPETVVFDFESKTGNGSIEIAGSTTWTQVNTATIASIATTGYGHDIILTREILDAELGLVGKFTNGFNIGSTFLIASVDPADATKITTPRVMTLVTSTDFEILKPSTSISGAADEDTVIRTTGNTVPYYIRDIHLSREDGSGYNNVSVVSGGLVAYNCCINSAQITYVGNESYADKFYLTLSETVVHPYGYISTNVPVRTELTFNHSAVGCAVESLHQSGTAVICASSSLGYDWNLYANSDVYAITSHLADTRLLLSGNNQTVELQSCSWAAYDYTNSNTGIQCSNGNNVSCSISSGDIDAGANFVSVINSSRVSVLVSGSVKMLATAIDSPMVTLYSNELCLYNTYTDMDTVYTPREETEIANMVVGPTIGTIEVSALPFGTRNSDSAVFNIYQKIGGL